MKGTVLSGFKKAVVVAVCVAMLLVMIPADLAMAETENDYKYYDEFLEMVQNAETEGKFIKICTLEDTLNIVSQIGVDKLTGFSGGLCVGVDAKDLFDIDDIVAQEGIIEETGRGAGDPYWSSMELAIRREGISYVTASTYGLSLLKTKAGASDEDVVEQIETQAREVFPEENWYVYAEKYDSDSVNILSTKEINEYYESYLYYLRKAGYGDYHENIYIAWVTNKSDITKNGWTFVTAIDEARTVESIFIAQKPGKLTYAENESNFDTEGGIIEVKYTDGSVKNKPMTPEMIQDFSVGQVGKQALTVMYRGKITKYEIDVVEKTLTNISMANTPWNTEYIEGATELNVSGGTIWLQFDNGETEYKEITQDMVSGFDSSAIGKQDITVTYKGKTTTYQIEIIEKSVLYIEMESEPNKLEYIVGKEALDVTGGKIRIYYNNDTSELMDISEDMATGFDNTWVGWNYITISYNGFSAGYYVQIVRDEISACIIEDISDKIYTGNEILPLIVIRAGDKTLIDGIDYYANYYNNINVGTATIYITGINNYLGSIRKTFQIAPASLSDKNMKIQYSSVEYDGTVKTPKVTVGNLVEGRDFKVTYYNNRNAGIASVEVTGIGNYTGTKALSFTITKVDISKKKVDDILLRIYDGSPQEPEVTIDGLISGIDYTVTYSDNIRPGIATVTIRGIGNCIGTTTATFEIILDPNATENLFGNEKNLRIYGQNRYDTSIETADALKKSMEIAKFENIIVADGRNYADALAGTYLAKVKNAPILVVGNDAQSQAKVRNYITSNLKSGGTVYILGGEGAVSKSFADSLKRYNVSRLWGRTRFETNIEILKAAGVKNEDILVCSGLDFADSLSASAAGKPILLVDKSLSSAQKTYLSSLSSKRYYIIGGTGAVNANVANELKSYGTTKRIYGQNRYSTSVAVAKEFFGANCNAIVLAYGLNFPDGLSGGPLAMFIGAPLILATSNDTSYAAEYAKAAGAYKAAVLGGPTLISDNAVKSILSNQSVQPPLEAEKIDKTIDSVANELDLTGKSEKSYSLIGAKDGAGFDEDVELYVYDENSEAYKKIISPQGYDYLFGNIKATAYNSGVVLIYTGDGQVSQQLVDRFKAIVFR